MKTSAKFLPPNSCHQLVVLFWHNFLVLRLYRERVSHDILKTTL